MALFSKKNIKSNPYGIREDDLKGDIEGFPLGVVVRMMEEQESQGNEPDVSVFQRFSYSEAKAGGFDWNKTEAGQNFWKKVVDVFLKDCDFDLFFKRYPEYARYNLA